MLNHSINTKELLRNLEEIFSSVDDDDFELDLEMFEEKKKKLYIAS